MRGEGTSTSVECTVCSCCRAAATCYCFDSLFSFQGNRRVAQLAPRRLKDLEAPPSRAHAHPAIAITRACLPTIKQVASVSAGGTTHPTRCTLVHSPPTISHASTPPTHPSPPPAPPANAVESVGQQLQSDCPSPCPHQRPSLPSQPRRDMIRMPFGFHHDLTANNMASSSATAAFPKGRASSYCKLHPCPSNCHPR